MILKKREEEVAREAATRADSLGKGKRRLQAVDYGRETQEIVAGSSPQTRAVPKDVVLEPDFQARPDTDVGNGDETMGNVTVV